MINYIKKIAIVQKDDPNNGGNDTLVILSAVNDGVDGASVFGYTSPKESLEIEAGNTYFQSANHELDIRVLKPTGNAYSGQENLQQIKDWVDNKTEVYVQALCVDGFITFGDYSSTSNPVILTANEQLIGNDVFALKITRKSTVGFDSGTSIYEGQIYAGTNGVGGYLWADGDGDGKADGWGINSVSGGFSFVNNIQTVEANTVSRKSERLVLFPFEGQEVTFSLTIDSIDANPYQAHRIQLNFLDNTDSSISTSSQDISSTGRVSVTDIVPSGTVSVICRFELDASVSNVSTSFSYPMFSINGSTEYSVF